MKKGVFIVAGILAVGGLAYLYFANKKKKEAVLSSRTSGASSTSGTATTGVGASSVNTEIPPLSTGGISPITNVESQQNLDKAKDIVAKINKSNRLPMYIRNAQVKSLNKKLKELGYKYSNGILSKL